jgi:hypothetical protein
MEDPDSSHFVRIPTEPNLRFTDCLDVTPSCTPHHPGENRLLTPFMYRRARELKSRYERTYIFEAVNAGNLTAVRHFIEVGTSVK